MEKALEIRLVTRGRIRGTVVIATVHGDIHEIGKNVVAACEGGGFEVIDLGDVPRSFIKLKGA